MPCRIAVTLLLALACASSPAFAADAGGGPSTSQYSLGDQTMSINAGVFLPLFMWPTGVVLLAPSSGSGSPPHLTPGAVGSLSWAAYVAPQIRIGMDIAGNFTLDPNANVLLMLPFIGKASYIFTFYPFEVPITLGIGANIVKYTTFSAIDVLLRPGAGFYWIYNSSWSFGANLNYWLDMQWASGRAANFLEFSLSALYHF
jgi:hypothetical protein